MKFQFFNIPAQDSADATNQLNAFCAQHRISNIEKNFVNNEENSFWSICVTFLDSEAALLGVDHGKRKKTIDYKEVLNDDDFTIFSQLRDLRKTIAEREGTPPYNVFTNEQGRLACNRRHWSNTS
jgi:superfamily II DNA helicase RecQ